MSSKASRKREIDEVDTTSDKAKKPATEQRTLAETLDDLHFEDEFEDELSDEEERLKSKVIAKERAKREAKLKRQSEMKNDDEQDIDEDEDEDEDDEEFSDEGGDNVEEMVQVDEDGKKKQPKYVWRPQDGMSTDEQLDYDSTAYAMLHRLHTEWPCLSFDILPDALGSSRTKYPHTAYLVAGTQADAAQKNKLMVMKIRDMHRTKHDDSSDDDDDDSDDESDASKQIKRDDPDESDDDDELDDDPIPEERAIPHIGCVNRVRACPQHPNLVATMSDTRHAHIFDISAAVSSLDSGVSIPPGTKQTALFTCRVHRDEGYALAWSPHTAGRLLSGDCAGGIYMWEPNSSFDSWEVSKESFKGHQNSVEDLAWSPSESTVFASASCDKTIRMWDVRMKAKCAAFVAAHKTDVNVISWNSLRQHLLASGADDGTMKVWDLRAFKSHTPAASFTWHTQAITSIEWHPQEDSIVACSSADNSLTVWDLSLETDAEEMAQYAHGAQVQETVPPQLYFVHAGQKEIKELHWHRQIPGMIISTAQDGFNLFKPDNLE